MSFFDYSDSVEYPIFLDECKSSEQLKKFRNTIDKHHQYMNSANIPSRRISFNMYETKSGNYIGGIGLASSVLALGGRDGEPVVIDNTTPIYGQGFMNTQKLDDFTYNDFKPFISFVSFI